MTSYSAWALAQIEDSRLGKAGEPRMAYEVLASSLVAVCAGAGQLFGLGLDKFDVDVRPTLKAAIIGALCEYKAHYEANEMMGWLFELDGIANRFGIDELRLTRRFPLRCAPLGAREGLSKTWQARLARLDAVREGGAPLELAAVGIEDATAVRLGVPDEEELYRWAVRFERGSHATFPRELAAWWSTANGIFVGDLALLEPVRAWSDGELGELEGLRIGAGSYGQGSLFLVGDLGKGIDALRLVETDDEVVTREYKTLGAYLDLLLGG